MFRIDKSMERKADWLIRAGGREGGEVAGNGHSVSVWDQESVLKLIEVVVAQIYEDNRNQLVVYFKWTVVCEPYLHTAVRKSDLSEPVLTTVFRSQVPPHLVSSVPCTLLVFPPQHLTPSNKLCSMHFLIYFLCFLSFSHCNVSSMRGGVPSSLVCS